jgi:hypothetical protein
MARPPESREHWERLAAELRAYRQAQGQAWGDLDDIQVARYLAGDCSPHERAAAEQAMRDLPDVREVIDVLRGVLPVWGRDAPAQPGPAEGAAEAASWAAARAAALAQDTVVQSQSVRARRALRRRTLLRAALVGIGLAASFLVGFLAGSGRFAPQPSGQPGERLLASLTAVPRDSRAAEAARVTLDDQGVYRITGGRDFALQIRSPRRGVATLVLLGPGQPLVYPLPGQADIAVEPLEPRKFGPLDRPQARTTVLVLVTATPAAETVRQHLEAAGAAPDQLEWLLAQLEQALWGAGQRWAALGRIVIEPAGRP